MRRDRWVHGPDSHRALGEGKDGVVGAVAHLGPRHPVAGLHSPCAHRAETGSISKVLPVVGGQLDSAKTHPEVPTIAIDGKTLRRSHDDGRGLGPLHVVSAWASEYGLSLGQVATEEKSNEITAIPELIDQIDVKGAIVTIDAMGCQKDIAKKIVDCQGRLRAGSQGQSAETAQGHSGSV